ncbi:peroxisomal biogenesis protein family-domain-containing protein [Scheffersomyces amazonensis]|uniref:peroxisomal biogenesis protein family-domain-containing protein n=1 Tax=Scheffersomyces amazonensis TaxID=1078765 RepID=UPI00315CED24
MSLFKKNGRNPKLFATALVATGLITISYKIYSTYFGNSKHNDEVKDEITDSITDNNITNISDRDIRNENSFKIRKQYSNQSIALTLSSSILSSKLPLDDILVKGGENIIFILPPNLSEDDLDYNLKSTPATNFKLLKCSNIQGYLSMLKNLKPDLLFVCSDDLGVSFGNVSKDLNNFIKTIINLDQNSDDIYLKIRPMFN